jgi:Protein of unknown function (DUF2807).
MKKIFFPLLIALAAFSCSKEKRECPGSIEKSFDFTDFQRIKLGDANTVKITKGDTYSIKAKGCSNDIADLAIDVEGGQTLNIRFRNHRQNRYRIDFEITMPALLSVNLSGASKGDISGFQGQQTVIRTILSGASECKLDGAGSNVSVDISGASVLNVTGSTESLYGVISGASKLESYGLASTEVDLSVSGSSKAWVKPVDAIYIEASGASRVYYKGNPAVKEFNTSGDGRVIQE